MKVLEKISGFFGKYMAIIVLAVAALALFVPGSCLWIQTSWVNYLLMIVMFGMGLTLKLEDFKLVFTRPKDIIIGCVAQFAIMPLLAWLLGVTFRLDAALLAGVVLFLPVQQRHHVSVRGRCGALCGHDKCEYAFGADPHAGHHIPFAAHAGAGRYHEHVFIHYQGRDHSHCAGLYSK